MAPTASQKTSRTRNSTCSTCFLILRERACMWAIRWATSPAISMRATSAKRVLMFWTRWATMPTACPPSSMPSRRVSILPSPPSRTSTAIVSSWTRLASRSTGAARCAPASPATTTGRSGRSRRCSIRSTASPPWPPTSPPIPLSKGRGGTLLLEQK